MIARPESWSARPSAPGRGTGGRATAAATVGIALLAAAWVFLHVAHSEARAIVDTPVYRAYGDAVTDGRLPYRDFELEYPPGALPAFVLPSLGASADYDQLFEALMLACGAAAVALIALTLAALDAPPARLYGATAFAAVSPGLLGPVVLSRFDLWPAALTVAALAALVAGRERLGLGALGLAVAVKLYPLVLLPIALVYVGKRRGTREAACAFAAFVAVCGAVVLPFAVLAPGGLAAALERQTSRPLQIESLGSSVLLAAHRVDGDYVPAVVSSYGSQNLDGPLPDALATVQTVLQALAVIAVWLVFARGRSDREALMAASAAAVAAFVAFGKVLSPQFLIWLLPLVPLVAGPAGLAAGGILGASLVLTQLWFPSRYWNMVALGPAGWLVLARDVVLVGLFAALVLAVRRRGREPGYPMGTRKASQRVARPSASQSTTAPSILTPPSAG